MIHETISTTIPSNSWPTKCGQLASCGVSDLALADHTTRDPKWQIRQKEDRKTLPQQVVISKNTKNFGIPAAAIILRIYFKKSRPLFYFGANSGEKWAKQPLQSLIILRDNRYQ